MNDEDDTEINGALVTGRATYSAIAKKPLNPLTSLRPALTGSLKGSPGKLLNPSRGCNSRPISRKFNREIYSVASAVAGETTETIVAVRISVLAMRRETN